MKLIDIKNFFFFGLSSLPSAEILVHDRSKFNSYVYKQTFDAIEEIKKRKADKGLTKYVERVLPEIPKPMKGKTSMVVFRHLATTNHEIIRFLVAADAIGELTPVIFEYTKDRFLSRNEWKHSLGKLRFYKGVGKNGEQINESKVIIDFGKSDNVPIGEVKTVWGERLVDFHHEMFFKYYSRNKNVVYDLSDWIKQVGGNAKQYYKSFLTLFLKDAILFENFLLNGKEKEFTKNVVVPAIQEIEKECGYKPLIVALEPTEKEADVFWLSHPYENKKFVDEKISLTKKDAIL